MCLCAYLGHGAAQDVLVLVLGDALLVVVRLQHQLHLLHHALLPVQLLQELQQHYHVKPPLAARRCILLLVLAEFGLQPILTFSKLRWT